jgi:hypothetical protein
MAFVQKPNNGALFRNERKEKETHPDYTGTLNVDGDDFYLNAWLKETKDGRKFFSISIKPKDQRGQKFANDRRRQEDDDQDPPF